MTPIQHGLLRHTLGLDRRKTANRNCLATGPDEDTFPDVSRLAAAGFMTCGAKIPGGLTYYHATDAGVAAAKLDHAELVALLTALSEAAGPAAVPVPVPAPPGGYEYESGEE